MKCIRAFSCSCLNDTMAAFRCVSTGWCCKILCFQCWSRRFPESTTAKPTTICLQRWYSQRAGKKDLPKYNYIYIHSKRERYIYMYQLNMTCLIKSKPMPWDTYLSNYIDLSVVVPLHLYSFIFLLQKEAQLSSSFHNGKSNFTFKSALWKSRASSLLPGCVLKRPYHETLHIWKTTGTEIILATLDKWCQTWQLRLCSLWLKNA